MIIKVGNYAYDDNPSSLLGKGQFGKVFKGWDQKEEHVKVVVKAINRNMSAICLTREICIIDELTKKERHPNIVALYEYVITTDHVFLVLEYCNGGDLQNYLQAKGCLNEDTIKIFLGQLTAAMKILRAMKIVHRDLKPANILLSHGEHSADLPQAYKITIKIGDFGLSRFFMSGEMAASCVGTPLYVAPEVFDEKPYGAKSHLWCLGLIIHECLTGKVPFSALSIRMKENLIIKSKWNLSRAVRVD
jgi:serine/threonine-protein kinase ULK/ATG1